ncbi:hypothetical protein GCM10025864_42760 [Luteimicrobium album]|uniref:Uncharacterized protein n=1 Tax=Luteimicrobium album TaxID=1054550 RepID=A0ABQ6I794_9MICO|nr:hypothetical protein GCM10025864_42760 [Luteimicrobium album]
MHAGGGVGVEELDHRLDREDRRTQVGQHDDAVGRRQGPADRVLDPVEVGAQAAVGQAARRLDRHRGRHLRGQPRRPTSELVGVRDEDERRRGATAGIRHGSGSDATTPAARMSAVDVAPGSWWPMLRSPR